MAPKIHRLKILPEYFEAILEEEKRFELRKDDRDYNVGDFIDLQEYENGRYTGRELRLIQIRYILRDVPEYGLKEGYCIIGF